MLQRVVISAPEGFKPWFKSLIFTLCALMGLSERSVRIRIPISTLNVRALRVKRIDSAPLGDRRVAYEEMSVKTLGAMAPPKSRMPFRLCDRAIHLMESVL